MDLRAQHVLGLEGALPNAVNSSCVADSSRILPCRGAGYQYDALWIPCAERDTDVCMLTRYCPNRTGTCTSN